VPGPIHFVRRVTKSAQTVRLALENQLQRMPGALEISAIEAGRLWISVVAGVRPMSTPR
jgi:hypothetical protein